MAVGTHLFRFHRRVIDPDERGPLLGAARGVLRAAAALYGVAVRARNGLYRLGWRRVHRADAPVISIGNITAGGTGKTPMVAWLARLLAIHKMRPAILSRGYGHDPESGLDDENALLARLAGGAPIVVDPDRVGGAGRAVDEHGAEVLIMDDGFQHRRLARDLDVVLVDAVLPFGGEHLLPRGLLREPLKELARADFLIVTRANLVAPDRLEHLKHRLRELAPDALLACCGTAVEGLRPVGTESRRPPERLREGRWGAFCGIGNPDGFRRSLEGAGCALEFLAVHPDHASYASEQVEELLDRARRAECVGLVTTEKDAVKVAPLLPAAGVKPPLYALEIDLEFTEGSSELTAAILEAAGKSP